MLVAGLVCDEPVLQLGRVAGVQQGSIVVELTQLALPRELTVPIHADISTTTAE